MPTLTPRAQAEAAARREREAAALRENLRRRKAQDRAREDRTEMPTVLVADGFRLFFFSREPNEPPHVHVKRAEATAKFWLAPVQLARNYGFPDHELGALTELVATHRQQCLEAWHGFFGA